MITKNGILFSKKRNREKGMEPENREEMRLLNPVACQELREGILRLLNCPSNVEKEKQKAEK